MLIKEIWQSKSGKIGLVLFLGIVLASFYALATFPQDFGKKIWHNPAYWADNPKNAPPFWTGFWGQEKARHRVFASDNPEVMQKPVGKNYIYRLKKADFSYPLPEKLSLSVSDIIFWEKPPIIEIYLEEDTERILLHRQNIPQLAGENQKPVSRYQDFPLRIDLKLEFTEPKSFITVLIRLADERDKIGKIKLVLAGETFGLLGTDSQGRDIFRGMLFGLPIALLIALSTAVCTTIIGASLAGVSGYYGGRIDNLSQRFVDLMSHFPLFILLIFIVFVLGSHLAYIVLILIIFGWPGIARDVRPWVLQIRASGFVEYALARGFSAKRIIVRHILVQILPYLLISIILAVPVAILAEAGLSFLGLGDASLPTWGQMLEQSYNTGAVYLGYWWQVLPPGFAIMGTIIVFWFLLRALEPIVEPRLKRGG